MFNSWSHYHNQDSKCIHHPQSFPVLLFNSSLLSLDSVPRKPVMCFLSLSISFPCLELTQLGHTACALSSGFFHSAELFGDSPVFLCASVVHSFLLMSSISLYGSAVHPPFTDWWIVALGVITKNAAMKAAMYKSLYGYIPFFLGCYLEVDWLNHMTGVHFHFFKLPECFPKWLCHFTTPQRIPKACKTLASRIFANTWCGCCSPAS